MCAQVHSTPKDLHKDFWICYSKGESMGSLRNEIGVFHVSWVRSKQVTAQEQGWRCPKPDRDREPQPATGNDEARRVQRRW